MRIVAALLTLIWTLTAVSAAARPIAPLPLHVASSQARAVQGLYVERRTGELKVEAAVAAFEADCQARQITPAITGRDLLDAGKQRLYRQTHRFIVYEEVPRFVPDAAACTGRIVLDTDWHGRKLVAGSAYVVDPASPGAMTGDVTVDDDEDTMHKLDWPSGFVGGDQPDCSKARRAGIFGCTKEKVQGIRATCFNLGDDFQGSHICISSQKDASYGLWLTSESYLDYDDGQPRDYAGYDAVLPRAKIDPVVFEPLR